MFHRRRFKLANVVILALLLTVALAPMAVAQAPPATDGSELDAGDNTGQTPLPGGGNGNGDGNGNGNGNGQTPLPNGNGNGNGDGNGNGQTPLPNGNGMNGDMNGDKDGDMMPMNWPPPNAIVRHAATPIQISSLAGGLQVYFIGADGATNGPLLASLSKLAEMHPDGAAVELFSGTNPGTGKPVTIQYLPDAMLLHVNTFYADKPPHDYNKAYIFTVDADHSVNHERW